MFNYPIFPAILIVGGIFIWLASLSIIVWKSTVHPSFTSGPSDEELKQKLKGLEEKAQQIKGAVEDNQRAIEWLQAESVNHLQKVGLVRFNPFKNTGGDQSFSLAALDARNSGFVFSSLHSRSGQRIYAKAIREGKPEKHELSDEEDQAISLAMSQKSRK